MKPKKVICPICGEEMIARNWGLEREMYQAMTGAKYAGESMSYVSYVCGCGNEMNYKGTKSCWEKCDCQCKSCKNYEAE